MSDLGHVDDANASHRRRLDRPDQCRDHGVSSHEAESLRCGTRRRQPPKRGIDRDQQVRPSMTTSQHVPRPQDRRRNAGRLNQRFTSHRAAIWPHHTAPGEPSYVHEVVRIGLLRRGSGGADRGEIDATEFCRLAGLGCGVPPGEPPWRRRDAATNVEASSAFPSTGSALRGSLGSEPGRTSA